MAFRRSRANDDGGQKRGFADRIATATKPEPSGSAQARAASVLNPGLTRYQRRTANLPAGAKSLTAEEVTNIVVDLRERAGENAQNPGD